MNSFDRAYLDVLEEIEHKGFTKDDRTGTGTISRFGTQARFNLKDNRIPLLSLRKVFHRSFIHETLWFLSGSTDIEYLKKNNVSIWDSWVKPGTERYRELSKEEIDEPRVLIGGSIGDGAYGSQWRAWDDTRIVQTNSVDEYVKRGFEYMGRLGETDKSIVRRVIDQIANVVQLLKTNPDSRRILLVAFNPSRVDDCVLPACHSFVQWWTRELTESERSELASKNPDNPNIPTRALSCHLYMRSNDVGVGAVFNIPQYGLLTHMLAQVTGMVAEEFIWTNGDSHIYLNHKDGLKELFNREGYSEEARVKLNPEITGIDDFRFEDIEIVNYKCGDTIKFPVAI